MLQRVCLALSVCVLALVFGGGSTYARWDGLGLTNARDATSLVISVKKHKHNDDDDNGDNHKHKKKNDHNDDSASENDQGSKDAKTGTETSSKGSTETPTTNPATTKCNVLWGDYCNLPKQ
jgi:hypothetical protein